MTAFSDAQPLAKRAILPKTEGLALLGREHAVKKKADAPKRPKRPSNIEAVDVFCGVGGLTRGLEKAGIKVKLGVDIDPACEYPYTANNSAKFLLKSVARASADDLGRFRKPGTPGL